jgi:hypothetical protein
MDVSSRYARYAAQASASPERYTRRAWGFSAVGVPEKKRSTLRAPRGELYLAIRGVSILRQTYSMVKSGETTVPYCAAFAPPGSVPFVLGEIVRVQMPHQHRILASHGRVSLAKPAFMSARNETYSPK